MRERSDLACAMFVDRGCHLVDGRARRHRDTSGANDDPYDVLGITPTTPWNEVVAEKRRLVKQHHPDHLGDASPEDRSAAEDRLRLINWAYTQVRADHGH